MMEMGRSHLAGASFMPAQGVEQTEGVLWLQLDWNSPQVPRE